MELVHRFYLSIISGFIALVIFVLGCFYFFDREVIFPKDHETARMMMNLAKEKAVNLSKWDEQQLLSILQPLANRYVYVHFVSGKEIFPALDSNDGINSVELQKFLKNGANDKGEEFHTYGGSWPLKNRIYGTFLKDKQVYIVVVERLKYFETVAIWILFIVSGIIFLSALIFVFSYLFFKPLIQKFETGFKKVLSSRTDVKAYFSLGGLKQIELLRETHRKTYLSQKDEQEFAMLKKEMALASSIQANLFPDHIIRSGALSIVSVFGAATHCTGDWWYHRKEGNADFLILADASGHGMPAALMTSAATAAVSTMAWSSELRIEEVIHLLNQAICHAGKAKINMTAVGFKFDWEKNLISVTSASHEFPYWYNSSEKQMDILIIDKSCPRLGESERSSYVSSEFPLVPGDVFMLYTDGIFELFSSQNKKFSERQFLKKIAPPFAENQSAVELSKSLQQILKDETGLRELPDDTTYIVCKIGDAG